MRRPIVAVVAWLAVHSVAGHAQSIGGARAGVVAQQMGDSVVAPANSSFAARLRPAIANRRYAPLASAIVPGSGQYILGNDRFVGYLAVEALGWWMYSKDVSERSAQERQFKDLASRVARIHFSTVLPDDDWAYYERMRDKIESGEYSKTTTGPVVPETDTSTYNGQRWAILQSIYPTYAEALAQYQKIAVKPEFRWSWRNHQLEYDIFKRTTDKRNDASRAAVRDLLVVGANHVLSMVDAFATIRLQIGPGPGGGTAVGAQVRW